MQINLSNFKKILEMRYVAATSWLELYYVRHMLQYNNNILTALADFLFIYFYL